MSKVFLGGTCNNSTWRNELIPLIQLPFFNPVVEDWTPECQQREIEEKTYKCNIHLYVITSDMKGVFSIAEVVDSAHTKNIRTILHVIPEGFDEFQLKSLQATVDLINSRGGIAYTDSTIERTARLLNNAFA